MTKVLSKLIMKRPQLKTKYFKTNNSKKICDHRKKKIVLSCLRKKERKNYHNSLKVKNVTE